jgi:hypothetical protein
MADTPAVKPTVASLVDAQGYVTVYDHGPQPPADDAAQPVKDAAAAEKKAWDVLNPDGYVAIRMPAVDAAHSIATDSERYALEPEAIDEGAVTTKMAEIKAKREAAAKAKEDATDRAQAVGEVVSDKASARALKAVADADKPKRAPPKASSPAPSPAPPATPKT